MAPDSLRQVGKYIRDTNRNANLAIKRYSKKMPTRDRVRDTISSINTFTTSIETDSNQSVFIDINFDDPAPSECASECYATACELFQSVYGGYSFQVVNPYEANTVRVYSNGVPLNDIQWYEEEPTSGHVYVQVQSPDETIVICYTYIVC